MRVLPNKIKIDDNGIYYLDIDDLELTELYFEELLKTNHSMSKFYLIDGNNDYILKHTPYPLIFNKTRTMNMLKNMDYMKDNIKKVDFPIGYFIENNRFTGTIIPYYDEGISIRNFLRKKCFEDLSYIYFHDVDEINNLMNLYIDMLDVIEELYNNDIVYLDIVHGGNFIIWNNEIKLIDFEPGLVKFTRNKEMYYKRMIESLCYLINCMNHRFKINDCILDPGENFEETKDNVKKMEKYLRRNNGI